jgi:hypothetical protein
MPTPAGTAAQYRTYLGRLPRKLALEPKFGDGEKHSLCNLREELSKWSGAKKSPMNDNLWIPTFETLWQAP